MNSADSGADCVALCIQSQRLFLLRDPVSSADSGERSKADPRIVDDRRKCFVRAAACCCTPRRIERYKRAYHGRLHYDVRLLSGATETWGKCHDSELVTNGRLARALVP